MPDVRDPTSRPRRRPRIALLVSGLVLVIATACSGGGDDDPPPTSTTSTTTTTEPAANSGASTAAFFEALTSRDPSQSAAMVAASAPGSVARSYALHQLAARTILGPTPAGRSERAPDRVVVCSAPAAPEQETACTEYADLAVDSEGRLTSFTVNGADITDRVLVNGPVVVVDRIEVHAVSAYRSPTSAAMFAVIEIANGSGTTFEMFPFAATYRPTEQAAAVEADASWGTAVVPSGATIRILLRFPDSALGGTLQISGWSEAETGAVFAVRLAETS
jgi:hypothetical protein